VKRLLTAVETIAAFFLLAIALLTFANVAVRDLFSVQIPDWFDFSKLMQVIAVFWGIALTTFAGRHICVDIVWEHVGPRAKRLIDLFATWCDCGLPGANVVDGVHQDHGPGHAGHLGFAHSDHLLLLGSGNWCCCGVCVGGVAHRAGMARRAG
jgi:hypothetical protein